MSFTADELWGYLPGKHVGNVLFATWYGGLAPLPADAALTSADFDKLLALREQVSKVLEPMRANGAIGAALEAEITVAADVQTAARWQPLAEELRFLFISGDVTVTAASTDDILSARSPPPRPSACAAGTTSPAWAATRVIRSSAAAASAISKAPARSVAGSEAGSHGSAWQRFRHAPSSSRAAQSSFICLGVRAAAKRAPQLLRMRLAFLKLGHVVGQGRTVRWTVRAILAPLRDSVRRRSAIPVTTSIQASSPVSEQRPPLRSFDMSQRPNPSALIWLLLSALVIGLDQWSKAWVLSSLPEYTSVPVIDGFWNWYRTYNTGAAFSF